LTFGRRRKRKMKLEAEKSFQCSVLSIQFSGKRGALEAEKRKCKSVEVQ